MVLHALGHINQIARGDLATRCENGSLRDRSFFPMEFCLNFLTRFRQLFLAKGLRSCNNLANKRGFRCCQWSRSAGSICSVDGWLFWAAGQPFNPKTKNCGTLEASFFLWRLIDELMNVVQVLEAFFDFQDLNQSCW